MKYRNLGPFSVSELGLGCASYWGKKHFSEQQAIRVVSAAIDQGVNYFDTGASYSGGHAEQRLGRILKHHVTDSELFISSKVGTEVGHFGRLYKNFSYQGILSSCERSLRRLGVNQLSVLFLHGPNPEDFNDHTYQALSDLKQSGKVALVGVNTFNPHIIKLTQQSQRFDVLMTDFNVFKPQQIETINQTRQMGMDVVIAGALGGALYSRQWRRISGVKSLWYWLRAYKNNRKQLQAAHYFDFLNKYPNWHATQLALAYVLNDPHFSSALVGSTSEHHIQQLADVSGRMVPNEVMIKIKQAQQQVNCT
ncbi:aldo/keto reductase [Marinicella gelatinilytica]|uniref:aldo/keto reductase n=1 Tax=Marinicella gelatinilytica TaxID=2996017 RepID=UPI002260FC9A|nr:aldo/keto reductase [Marinicella gelatinilytica]MCX7544826.1 aldo/keto reductase [Marinicella gelatinilytica]